jgi:hypothetical protein
MNHLSIRKSTNIQHDIQRNFSCWMGGHETLEAAVTDIVPEYVLEAFWHDEAEMVRRFGRIIDDWEDFIAAFHAEYLDDVIICDDIAGLWRFFHHDGLACYAVVDEAEVREMASGSPSGQGDQTVGRVEVVEDLGDNWYLLRSQDIEPESEMTELDFSSRIVWMEKYN